MAHAAFVIELFAVMFAVVVVAAVAAEAAVAVVIAAVAVADAETVAAMKLPNCHHVCYFIL